MESGQIFDPEGDQNDVESQYLWNLKCRRDNEKLFRINLATLKINYSFSKSRLSQIIITNWNALPNNQIFGRYEEKDQDMSYLFIADENANIKIIKSASLRSDKYAFFVSCYYDDSIFIIANGGHAERYLISQNRWINLTKFPSRFDSPKSCIGFEQKILISKQSNPGLWVYDIILDSYSDINALKGDERVWMIKDSGIIYALDLSYSTTIKYCWNPFSKWRYVNYCDELKADFDYTPFAYFYGSIYYLRDDILYEYSLETFTSRIAKVIPKF